MVDASYAPVSDKVVAAIRKFSSEPLRYLVNTHSHPDHTGGNPNMVKLGALLLARETAREQISQPLPAAAGDAASRTDPARLPVVTYGLGEPVNIRMNGEIIHLIPVRPAHTSGDSLVRFENSDVIMIGDFYRNLRVSVHRYHQRRHPRGCPRSARRDDAARRPGHPARAQATAP